MSFLSKFRTAKKTERHSPSKPGLIGLDLGSHSLHLCQLKPRTDNRYTIQAKSSIGFNGSRQQLLEDPKSFKKLLGQAIKGKKFKGRKVTAIMPPDQVKIMLISYKANATDINGEIVRILSQRIDGDIDDYVIDYLPVRNNSADEEHIVMASIALRVDVEKLLNTLSFCGLEVHSLDIGPASLKRLVAALYTDNKTDNVLLINIGDETSYLTIVSGRRLLFDQPVNFGCNTLLKDISAELDISTEKALELVYRHGFNNKDKSTDSMASNNEDDYSATLIDIVKPAFLKLLDEINRVLVFTSSETHGIPISRVLLLGCMARWPGAQNLIMSLLDISLPEQQTEFYDIFIDKDESTEPWVEQLPEMAIATGLALRGLDSDG